MTNHTLSTEDLYDLEVFRLAFDAIEYLSGIQPRIPLVKDGSSNMGLSLPYFVVDLHYNTDQGKWCARIAGTQTFGLLRGPRVAAWTGYGDHRPDAFKALREMVVVWYRQHPACPVQPAANSRPTPTTTTTE